MSTDTEPIRPTIGKNVFIASTAHVGGEVTIAEDARPSHVVNARKAE